MEARGRRSKAHLRARGRRRSNCPPGEIAYTSIHYFANPGIGRAARTSPTIPRKARKAELDVARVLVCPRFRDFLLDGSLLFLGPGGVKAFCDGKGLVA